MRTFRFRHTWHVPADVGTVFAALADVDRYPQWWPQVRRVVRLDGSSGHAFVRSVLPYTLDLVLTREVEDSESGLLRVSIAGDLEGWSAFALSASDGSTLARYEQECCLGPSVSARIVPVAAPLLRLNHTWMMRSGERGLARWLTGTRPPSGHGRGPAR